MNALLHFPYWDSKPDGIWWFDGSAVLGEYYPDNPELAMLGEQALRRVHYRADEYDISDIFTRMAERWPMPDHYETVTLTNIDAKAFLDLVRGAAPPKAA